MIQLGLFAVQIVLLYFVSRTAVNEFFYFLQIIIRNDGIIFGLVSLFYLPGTIIHEMSHFFAALLLLLQVREVKIFPEWDKKYIKLGHVIYGRQDVVRSVLVGIAPFSGAMLFFLLLSVYHIFPSNVTWLNIVLGYVVFSVASSMFSSKQDLIDIAYMIPLVILIGAAMYLFNIRLDTLLQNKAIIAPLQEFLKRVNFYIVFSLAANVLCIIVFRSLRKLLHR